jgi:hypothetical protein
VPPERLVSLKDAAAHYGLSYSHLALLARTDKLQAWEYEGRVLTTLSAVAAYMHDPTMRARGPRGRRRKSIIDAQG